MFMRRCSNSVEVVLADHRVARHAALAATGRDLEQELPADRLLVEPALARHHRERVVRKRVEADGVKHERRARAQRRARERPQPARKAAARAGHRLVAGSRPVSRRAMAAQSVSPLLDLIDLPR